MMLSFLERLAIQQNVTKLSLESTLNAISFVDQHCGYDVLTQSIYHSPRGIKLESTLMYKTL